MTKVFMHERKLQLASLVQGTSFASTMSRTPWQADMERDTS